MNPDSRVRDEPRNLWRDHQRDEAEQHAGAAPASTG
jgi:hypothetical protein